MDSPGVRGEIWVKTFDLARSELFNISYRISSLCLQVSREWTRQGPTIMSGLNIGSDEVEAVHIKVVVLTDRGAGIDRAENSHLARARSLEVGNDRRPRIHLAILWLADQMRLRANVAGSVALAVLGTVRVSLLVRVEDLKDDLHRH